MISKKIAEWKISYLHIFSLFTLSVSQPLYHFLALPKSQPFFIAQHASFINVLFITFIWSIFFPSIFCAIIYLTKKINLTFSKIIYFLIVFFLLFCLFFPLFKHSLYLSLIASIAVIYLIISFAQLNKFFNFLSVATFFSASFFLVSSNVQDTRSINTFFSQQVKKNNNPDIILVVFDQIPLTSLLNHNLTIDENLFPNFANFAKTATWYKNAFTLYTHTRDAIPSIVTGSEINLYRQRLKTLQEQIKNRTPDQKQFPKNLFTELSSSHKMNVFESVTALGPKNSFSANEFSLKIFLADTMLLAAYTIVGNQELIALPKTDDKWTNFFNLKNSANNEKFAYEFQGERANMVEDFIASLKKSPEPTFNFLHVVLPHVPFEYDEYGKIHNKTTRTSPQKIKTRIGIDIWGGKEGTKENLALHIAQTRFVDLLFGKIIKKLKDENMFDSSIVILTADHGIDFFYDDLSLDEKYVKKISEINMKEIPLFIKYPFQKDPEQSEKIALNTDIAPTVADVLNKKLSWQHEGISLFRNNQRVRNLSFVTQSFAAEEKTLLEKIAIKQRLNPQTPSVALME